MTKLKGTILLGEGYNKTKAIFNGNIDNLEVKSIAIKDSTAKDILLGDGTTLPLFNEGNIINSQYLPSYVDDVIEAPSRNDFPTIGESGKIYLDISTNSTYRWSGSTYAPITSGNEEIGLIKELIELIQNTLKKEDPYWEYYEYEHVPLTIEALGDGTIEFLPHMSTNVIEGSLDGGKTWVSITNNPIQLVSGDKLLLKGSVIGSIDADRAFFNCGKLITQFPYNAFGNPSLLLKGNAAESDIDYEYIFSALLAMLFEQNGLIMHKLLEQLIEGFEALSFKEKVITILSMIVGYDPSEEELLQFVSLLRQQYGTVSFLEAVSTICNTLQPQFPDLNVDEDFLLTVFKEEFGEDVTLHDIVAMLYESMLGGGSSNENPLSTFDNFLAEGVISAENLYLDAFAIKIFKGSSTLQIAPKVIDLDRYPQGISLLYMFENCTALTKAPELPATKLSEDCYLGMFSGCVSLTVAPKLPATELGERCYRAMFEDCKSLIAAPELPATTLIDSCYEFMFDGCVSLALPPKLPATELVYHCYKAMFRGCTSLTTAPELPATTLTDYCYTWMFDRCTNLNYIKMLTKNTSYLDTGLWEWVKQVAAEGTFVKTKGVDIPVGVDGIPEGWTVIEEESIESLSSEVGNLSSEIDILKNRIISTTYSELKDAVTNSTLTTGQYYRITDYVTTCNGTSAKVTDASTIDPENPVDGQSRSAGHLFDIIVRALSPNQLDENAIAVCNASETYYDSTFNGTVIKYSIENKYWSTEDGKGTIYYMKDHNDNECSYDFTNIEYYYAESTTWYLTFNKDSSKVVILNTNTVLPFVIIYGYGESPNSISITGSLLEIYMYAGAINAVDIKGTINNFKVKAPTNKRVHTINITGMYETTLLKSEGLISTITFNGYLQNVLIQSGLDLGFFTIYGLHLNLTIKSAPGKYCLRFFMLGQSSDSSIDASEIPGTLYDFICFGHLYKTTIKGLVLYVTICGSLQDSTIEAKGISKVVFQGVNKNLVINTNNNALNSSTWNNNSNITILGGTHTMSCLHFALSVKGITILPYAGLTASYIHFEPGVFNITVEGTFLNVTLTDVARNLYLKSTQEAAFAADVTIHGIRGVSAESLLEIPLDLIVKGGCTKDIYGDVSGRIFYTWEDNLVKKGYYLNDNTDTEWKEIPTSEKPVEVSTIPDAVTTALSVATLDLTTRTTIATIATDETLAFTLVPAIQGEYRLVVVNSSEADITITMPTEENYQCLCGATLTIPAQTNIELIINVTDTLIYIRKG